MMYHDDAEKLRANDEARRIAKEFNFVISYYGTNIIIKRENWSYGIEVQTIHEMYQFLNGFEMGYRADGKEKKED